MTDGRAARAAARALPVSVVLFDLDGTLADTAGDLAGAVNRVRADRGLPPVPVTQLRAHASSGARGLIGAGMGVAPNDAGYAELRDAFLAYYATSSLSQRGCSTGFRSCWRRSKRDGFVGA